MKIETKQGMHHPMSVLGAGPDVRCLIIVSVFNTLKMHPSVLSAI